MQQRRPAVIVLLLAALTLPVFAAVAAAEEGAKQCPGELEPCLREMVSRFRHRGWVGIEIEQDEESKAMTVLKVIPDSPAEEAGLEAGDRILALNGVAYSPESKERLKEHYDAMVPGKTIAYTVLRRGKQEEVRVHLAKVPDNVIATWIGYHALHYHHELEQAEGGDTVAQKSDSKP